MWGYRTYFEWDDLPIQHMKEIDNTIVEDSVGYNKTQRNTKCDTLRDNSWLTHDQPVTTTMPESLSVNLLRSSSLSVTVLTWSSLLVLLLASSSFWAWWWNNLRVLRARYGCSSEVWMSMRARVWISMHSMCVWMTMHGERERGVWGRDVLSVGVTTCVGMRVIVT